MGLNSGLIRIHKRINREVRIDLSHEKILEKTLDSVFLPLYKQEKFITISKRANIRLKRIENRKEPFRFSGKNWDIKIKD